MSPNENTTTAETVTVTKDTLGPVIRTYMHAYGRDKNAVEPEAAAAIRIVLDLDDAKAADIDTVTLDATTAWILAHHADTLYVYGLDEADEATYAHPAVIAQEALRRLVADQAPATEARLSSEFDVQLAARRGGNRDH